ncbi:MAG: hypothetical protein R3B65_01160 [Candidatus Paceibacterota bacterium]
MSKNSVQFFGLPGSGKTSTLKSLVKNYPDKYILVPSFSRFQRFKLFTLFILKFPKISFTFLYFVFGNDKRLWKYILHLVTNSFATHVYVLLQKSDEKTFLIDEGVFQRILSVLPKRLTDREAKNLVQTLTKIPSRVIVTHGGNFSRFTLESDRMISPRNKLGEKYFKDWSENLRFNFESILKALGDRKIEKGESLEELNKKI